MAPGVSTQTSSHFYCKPYDLDAESWPIRAFLDNGNVNFYFKHAQTAKSGNKGESKCLTTCHFSFLPPPCQTLNNETSDLTLSLTLMRNLGQIVSEMYTFSVFLT